MTAAKDELRDFLRTRRARLQPQDVGLPGGRGERRVPGLRREEIALLAGMSVDYYVRLEQGRSRNISASALDAVAQALHLNDQERRHLFDLAQVTPLALPQRASPPRDVRLRPAVATLLDAMELQPAYVIGHRMDILAVNWLGRQLLGDLMMLPTNERNLARFLFLDKTARRVHPDWSTGARECVAMLRMYAGRHPDDPALMSLVNDLSAADPTFVEWWTNHDVHESAFCMKRFRHPLVGELSLSYEALQFPDDPEQRVCVYTAAPGSASERSLRMLAAMRHTDSPVVEMSPVGIL